jgi:hypothetical protein
MHVRRLAYGIAIILAKHLTLACTLLCLWSLPGLADEWVVGTAPGSNAKAAETTNVDGHQLFIWAKHLEDRSLIFAELQLRDGDGFGGRMPVYRINDGKPIDTELIRREGEKQGSLWGFVAGPSCFWLIWSSNRQTVEPGDHLAQWMNGTTLKVNYQGTDGSQRSTRFNLDGARAAIEQATEVALQ